MSTTEQEVMIEALSLSARSRAELAHKLLVSLEAESASAEVAEAWKQEATDRCHAYDEGKLADRDAVDVLRDAYRKVK